jgi:hypothetical protein
MVDVWIRRFTKGPTGDLGVLPWLVKARFADDWQARQWLLREGERYGSAVVMPEGVPPDPRQENQAGAD